MKSTYKNKHSRVWLSLLLLMVTVGMAAQNNRSWRNKLREESPEFFKTEEARRIGEQVMLFQRVTGGWPKNIDMVTPLNDSQREQVMKDKEREDDSTTDNGATTMQMVYLARLYQATKDKAVPTIASSAA